MPVQSLALIGQRNNRVNNPEADSGTIRVGVENDPGGGGDLNAALQFALPSLPAGSTIDSVILKIFGRSVATNADHRLNIGIISNDTTLAGLNLATMSFSSASRNMHGPGFTTPGVGSVLVPATDGWVELDLTTNYISALSAGILATRFILGIKKGTVQNVVDDPDNPVYINTWQDFQSAPQPNNPVVEVTFTAPAVTSIIPNLFPDDLFPSHLFV